MPRTEKKPIEFNNAVAGLITEASPLNFPPNASLDEENFVLLRDGSRQRRLGLDLEDGFSKRTLTTAEYNFIVDNGINVFMWEKAGKRRNINLGVVQVGHYLYIYEVSPGSAVSANLKSFSKVAGSPFFPVPIVTASEYNNEVFTFAVLNGFLVVAGHGKEVVTLELREGGSEDGSQDVLVKGSVQLQVRDLWGVYDAVPDDYRLA